MLNTLPTIKLSPGSNLLAIPSSIVYHYHGKGLSVFTRMLSLASREAYKDSVRILTLN